MASYSPQTVLESEVKSPRKRRDKQGEKSWIDDKFLVLGLLGIFISHLTSLCGWRLTDLETCDNFECLQF